MADDVTLTIPPNPSLDRALGVVDRMEYERNLGKGILPEYMQVRYRSQLYRLRAAAKRALGLE